MADQKDIIPLKDLVDRLGIEYDSRNNAHCPFCDPEGKYRKNLHFEFTDDKFRCNRCGQNYSGPEGGKGRTLHFFSLYVLGKPLPPKGQGRAEVREKLFEFMGESYTPPTAQQRRAEKQKAPEVPVLPDAQLDAVYSAMANIPVLQLTKEDEANLLKRGLSKEAIERNGYRSIPYKPFIPDCYHKMYEDAGGDHLKQKLFKRRIDSWKIKLGLMIGHTLTSAGYTLKGVPGFYQFGDHWCLHCSNGILIPTRNMHKQIVIWQLRQNSADPSYRYITLACGSLGLPGVVTEKVSRCHFPMNNAPFDGNADVLYTEGPLKADVASELYGHPSVFLAIPGIGNTEDMFRQLGMLCKAYDLKDIYSALDMDRLTNHNVQSGSRKIHEYLTKELHLAVHELYWGTEYAERKLNILSSVAKLRAIPVPIPRYYTVFNRLDLVTEALWLRGIDACTFPNPCGRKQDDTVSYYWEKETKGIDDFLFHYANQGQNDHSIYATSGEDAELHFDEAFHS